MDFRPEDVAWLTAPEKALVLVAFACAVYSLYTLVLLWLVARRHSRGRSIEVASPPDLSLALSCLVASVAGLALALSAADWHLDHLAQLVFTGAGFDNEWQTYHWRSTLRPAFFMAAGAAAASFAMRLVWRAWWSRNAKQQRTR